MELRNGRVRATKTSKKMTPRVLPLPPTPSPLGRQCRSVSLAAATASPALCGSAQGHNCTSPLKSPINQPYTFVTMLQVKPNCYPYGWNSHNGQTARSVRKPRILFTPQQSRYLEERFQEGQFPSIATRECMANLLELTPQQITIWFQNRRARTRRQSRRCKDDEPRKHMPKPPSFWPQHLPFDSNFIGVLNGDKGDKGTTGTPSSSSASEPSKGESNPTSSPPEKSKSNDELLQEHITPPSSTTESTVSTSPLSSPMTATATHVGCSTMSHSPDNVSVSVSVLHRRHSSTEASTCNSLQHAYSTDTTPNASILAAHLLPSFSSICGNSYTSSRPVYHSVGYIPPQIPAPPPATTTIHCGIGYMPPEQAAMPYYSTDHVPSAMAAMSSCNVPPVPSVLPYCNNGYVLPNAATTSHCSIGYMPSEQTATRSCSSTDRVPSILVATSSYHIPSVKSSLSFSNAGSVPPKPTTQWSIGCVPPKPTAAGRSVGYVSSKPTAAIAHSNSNGYTATDISVGCIPLKSMANNNIDYVPPKATVVTNIRVGYVPPKVHNSVGHVPPKPSADISVGYVPPKPSADISVGHVPPKPSADISVGYVPPKPTGRSVGHVPPKPSADISVGYVAPKPAADIHVGYVPPKPSADISIGYVPPKPAAAISDGYVPPKPAADIRVGYVPPKPAADISVGYVPPKPAADICVGYVPPKPAADIHVGYVPPKAAADIYVGYVPPKPAADIHVGYVPPKPTGRSVGYVPPKPAADIRVGYVPPKAGADISVPPNPMAHNHIDHVPPKLTGRSVGYVPPKPTETMAQNNMEYVSLRPTATTDSSTTSYLPFKATSLPSVSSTACTSASQAIPSMESISSTALFLMSKSGCASAAAGEPISHTSLPLSRPVTHPDTLTASIVTQPSTVNGTLTTFSHGQSSSAIKKRSISCSTLERVEEVTALPSIDQFDLLDLPAAIDSTVHCHHDLMLPSPIYAEAPIPLVDILGEEWDLLDPILNAEYQETCLAPESSVHHPPSDTNKSSFHCHQTAPLSVPTNSHIPLGGHSLVENPITHAPSFTPQWHNVPLLPPENRHSSPARTHIAISKPPLCYSNGPFQSSMAQYTNPFPPQFPNVRASVPPYALSSH